MPLEYDRLTDFEFRLLSQQLRKSSRAYTVMISSTMSLISSTLLTVPKILV